LSRHLNYYDRTAARST